MMPSMTRAAATSFDLSNGLRFVVAEDHAAPVATLGLWVRAGVCDEPDDCRGMAHFLEHLMFRGSENFAPKEHTKRISLKGGSCNAFTSFDMTVYHESFPSHALAEMFELESDRFMRLKLDPESIEIEKKVVLEEIRVYENQPMSRAFRRLLRALGGEHPYALDPLGHFDNVESCRFDDLATFYRQLYRPGNTFVVVCGDVDIDEVKKLAEQYFGEWSDPEGLSVPRAVAPFRLPTGDQIERVSIEVPVLARAHTLPSSDKVDHTALNLLCALLADGEASPIRETLVKKKRLCVEAGGMNYNLLHGGALVFFGAFLPPGKFEPRHAVIRDICSQLAEEGPDEALFEEKLRRFKKRFAFESYSSNFQMLQFGEAELHEGDYRKYETRMVDLAEVTPARVQNLARELFVTENTLELSVIPENQKWYMPLVGLAMKAVQK